MQLARENAWVSRFLDNCYLPKAQRTAGEIALEEIKAAEAEILRFVGRLKYAAFIPPHETLFPVNLP